MHSGFCGIKSYCHVRRHVARLNIPPQVDRGWNHFQLGFQEEKPGSGQPIGKDICNLISSRYRGDEDIPIEDLLADKVIVNFYMLGMCMKDRIGGECKGTNIVTPGHSSNQKRDLKFTKEHTNPKQLDSNNWEGAIFDLNAWSGHNLLFLSTPRDQAVTKEDNIAIGGAAIIRIACPIGVRKSIELESAFGIKEAMIYSILERL